MITIIIIIIIIIIILIIIIIETFVLFEAQKQIHRVIFNTTVGLSYTRLAHKLNGLVQYMGRVPIMLEIMLEITKANNNLNQRSDPNSELNQRLDPGNKLNQRSDPNNKLTHRQPGGWNKSN